MSAGSVPVAPPNPPRAPRHRYRSRSGAHQSSPQEGTNVPNSTMPSLAPGSSVALQPASVISQSQQEPPMVSEHSGIRGNGPRMRAGRGRRSGGRGRSGTHQMSGTGRAFGGQLTRNSGPSAGSLQADAPEFQPGQPVQPRQ